MTTKITGMESLRSELLDDVSAHTKELLVSLGVASEQAQRCGVELADWLAKHWGGQLINIPKDYRYKLAQRDEEIYADFDGFNHAELAKKYGMTTRGIYKVLGRVRNRRKNT